MILFVDFLARIGSAFLMGTLIGLERQYRQRNAGLRTNILVSVGAAAFTVLSYSMTTGNGDPSRVAAQIVSGIGFLGGGLILKDGFNVRGVEYGGHHMVFCSLRHLVGGWTVPGISHSGGLRIGYPLSLPSYLCLFGKADGWCLSLFASCRMPEKGVRQDSEAHYGYACL